MASVESSSVPTAVRLAPPRVIGGVGGFVFVTTVVVQNVIRGSIAPKNDAAVSKVVEFYADHRSTTLVLAALFVVGAVGGAAFNAGLLSRLAAAPSRAPALAGTIGFIGVFALFSSVVATDVALSGYVHLGSPNTDVVSALWTLHNSLFGILGIALGIALAGFSAAAAAGGLVAAPWKQAGGVAALLLAVSAATTPLALDGSPVMFVGLVGFLVWLVFVATTSRALLGNR